MTKKRKKKILIRKMTRIFKKFAVYPSAESMGGYKSEVIAWHKIKL